ncbi:hypothetical protein Hanom_Chr14g01262491 [Helianthus anomalus]
MFRSVCFGSRFSHEMVQIFLFGDVHQVGCLGFHGSFGSGFVFGFGSTAGSNSQQQSTVRVDSVGPSQLSKHSQQVNSANRSTQLTRSTQLAYFRSFDTRRLVNILRRFISLFSSFINCANRARTIVT